MEPPPDYVVASGSLPPTVPIISKVGDGDGIVPERGCRTIIWGYVLRSLIIRQEHTFKAP